MTLLVVIVLALVVREKVVQEFKAPRYVILIFPWGTLYIVLHGFLLGFLIVCLKDCFAGAMNFVVQVISVLLSSVAIKQSFLLQLYRIGFLSRLRHAAAPVQHSVSAQFHLFWSLIALIPHMLWRC